MIHLEQNQQLRSDPHLRVAVETGDYNETDLIECYPEGSDPDSPTCMFQAQYVALGKEIYHQIEELTENQVAALVSGTPASEVINNRRFIDGKRPAAKYEGRIIKRRSGKKDPLKKRQDISEATEISTSTPAVTQTNDPIVVNNDATNNVSTSTNSTATSTTTDPISAPETDTNDTSTSTPPIDIGDDSASSTPETTVSTTTPAVIDDGFKQDAPQIDQTQATTTVSIGEGGNPDIATTTPAQSDISTTTSDVTSQENNTTSTDTSTTTSEIISFAKRKIAKKIFNI